MPWMPDLSLLWYGLTVEPLVLAMACWISTMPRSDWLLTCVLLVCVHGVVIRW